MKQNFYCPSKAKTNKQTNKQTVVYSLLILCALLLGSNVMKAQIKVDSDGDIGLHSTATDPSSDIFLNGSVKVNSYFYFNQNGLFRPISANNSTYIGHSSFPFGYVHANNIYAYEYFSGSDRRFKKNFSTIDSPLAKLLKLNGVKYDFIIEKNDSIDQVEQQKKENLGKNKLGFIAQEVKEILPEAVIYDNETDRYFLDYNAIIPVIVEAMKEQETKIMVLEKEIELLKNAPLTKSATIQPEQLEPVASLGQNVPNPFSSNTQIQLFLPKTVSQAALYVYNMQGAQIKKFNIRDRENTSILIEGNTMEPGMYLYTLIADGKEVDTKKMILTK
ncbi:MAG: T9SS type A sorting domain-containing protein [Bacteroidales bacterium]|nr:T9SS type A sorting domain-containing protein [Bacteroidales bacterium]